MRAVAGGLRLGVVVTVAAIFLMESGRSPAAVSAALSVSDQRTSSLWPVGDEFSHPHLSVRMGTRGVRYPLGVRARMPRGRKLVGVGEVGRAGFGYAVALSSDGKTALIGGSEDRHSRGAVWVFTRVGASWRQQGGKLTARGEVGPANFGWDVALSADGKTALISGLGDRNGVGAAWVFVRRDGRWQQQGKLTAGDELGTAEFGYSVALSADGNTALVGGPDDHRIKGLVGNQGYGAAWVFTRRGSSWTQQALKLTARGDTPTGLFGFAVALSADANTAVIGAPNVNHDRGVAWVFSRRGSGWSQRGGRLVGTGEVGRIGEFGAAVALSAHGNLALIGGPGDKNNAGAVWTFTRRRSTWIQQGKKLTAGGEIGSAGYGISIAVSPNGRTALIGGFLDNNHRGAAWRYTRNGPGWSQTGSKLTARDAIGTDVLFGTAVALSSDGQTALIGGSHDDHKRGAVWIFDPPSP